LSYVAGEGVLFLITDEAVYVLANEIVSGHAEHCRGCEIGCHDLSLFRDGAISNWSKVVEIQILLVLFFKIFMRPV
jgi:hypothetical protein